ncbi:MAG: DHH family phosphoesterase [Proteobacteria bacterium]|nr:DHH family phosphoesterase [Pseudomonadota bacterium]
MLLASHTNPDGDAIGSLLALGIALDWLDKKIFLFNESPIPAVYRFLPFIERIEHEIPATLEFDTAVILDCGNIQRIGKGSPAACRIPVILNIDHHITNNNFGTCQLVDTKACSTAEIVYRTIKKMEIPINSAIATSIYTGILTDTGSFRFSNTNKSAFAICEEMIGCGVNPYEVAQHVYGTYSLGRIRLLNLALDSIEISTNGKLSMMTITQEMIYETGTNSEDIDGLINYAKRIEDVKVAALIQEQKTDSNQSTGLKTFHVSLRSDGTFDVSAIASAFGGGGHSSAAGFNIETTLEALKTQIIRLSEKI